MDSNLWGDQGPVSDPGEFTCDGRWHTDTFTVRIRGAMGLVGCAREGRAWVQFCLTGEDEQGEFVVANRWTQVK